MNVVISTTFQNKPVILGRWGVKIFFSFFFDLSNKYAESKKMFQVKKFSFFYSGHFEKKSCLILQTLQTLGQKNGYFDFPPPYRFSTIKILRSFQQSGILCLMIKLRQLMFKIDVHTPGTKYNTFCKILRCKISTNRAKH